MELVQLAALNRVANFEYLLVLWRTATWGTKRE